MSEPLFLAILYLIGLSGSAVVAVLLYRAVKRFDELIKKLEALTHE